MRILYVSASDGVHDARFIRAWSDAGADVEACIMAEGGTVEVRDAIARFRPDVVHAGPIPTVARAVIDVWDGALIATSWGFDLLHDTAEDPAAAQAAREVMLTDAVILTDNDAVSARAVQLGANPARIISFPWGIDHERFASTGPDLRDELGLGPAQVILSVRRHEAIYDVQTLIRAFPPVARAFPSARLLIGGGGGLTSTLQGIASASGVANRIVFLGERTQDDLAELYRTADIYVSTALTDGSSISLLEAMACGAVPVVADVPGNRQWVDDSTGSRFAPGDAPELAEALIRALGDDRYIPERSRNSRERVLEAADWRRGPGLLMDAARHALERRGCSS
jgi:glycosyltransferase involved in cell wall biosynthesis